MAFSEGLSDTGDITGRGSPALRGAITGGGTFAGGIFHTLPFLIPGYGAAISAAVVVVAAELLTLAWLRHRYFQTSFARSSSRSPSAERSSLPSVPPWASSRRDEPAIRHADMLWPGFRGRAPAPYPCSGRPARASR